MALTSDERAKAEKIVGAWYWQAAEVREKRQTRYYESAPLEADELKLVIEHLRTQTGVESFTLHGKAVSWQGRTWEAVDAWFRTEPGETFAGTTSRKVRIYQTLLRDDYNSEDQIVVEDGCQYKVEHTFYWDVGELPEVPASTSGVTHTLTGVTRDRETERYSCVLETRTRIEQTIDEYATRKTAFETATEEVHLGVRGETDQGGKAAAVTPGKIVTRRVTKNADCTHDVQNTTTESQSVEGASVRNEELLRGTRTTTRNVNMSEQAPAENLGPGDSVLNEMTEDKRWNQTIVRFTRHVLGFIRRACTQTIFEHSDSTTTNVGEQPEFDHVVEAGGGIVREKSVTRMEEGGFDIIERTTEEKGVTDASETVSATLTGVTRSVTHRNQPSPASTAGLDIGESVTNEKTPGGLWNVTIRSRVRAVLHKIGEACAKTVFQHTHSTTTIEGEDPGFDHVAEAGDGVTIDKRVTRTADGDYQVSEEKTTEKPVASVAVEYAKTLRGTQTSVTHKNQPDALTGDGLEVGERRSSRMTPGGRYDNTVTTTTPDTTSRKLSRRCHKTSSVHTDAETTSMGVAAAAEYAECADAPDANEEVEISFRANEDGATVDVTTAKTTYTPTDTGEVEWRDDEHVYVRREYQNQGEVIKPTRDGRASLTFRDNGHGTLDGGYSVVAPIRTRTKIIDEGRDTWARKSRRYGSWTYTVGNVTTTLNWVWEYRRFTTMRYRVIGLTEAAADALQETLSEAYTRQTRISVFIESGSGAGGFEEQDGGYDRMARVVKYHIEGDVWGVLVDVREQSVRLRSDVQPQGDHVGGILWVRERQWSYP